MVGVQFAKSALPSTWALGGSVAVTVRTSRSGADDSAHGAAGAAGGTGTVDGGAAATVVGPEMVVDAAVELVVDGDAEIVPEAVEGGVDADPSEPPTTISTTEPATTAPAIPRLRMQAQSIWPRTTATTPRTKPISPRNDNSPATLTPPCYMAPSAQRSMDDLSYGRWTGPRHDPAPGRSMARTSWSLVNGSWPAPTTAV